MSYNRYGRNGLDAVWYLIIANSIIFVITFFMETVNSFFYNVRFIPAAALVPAFLNASLDATHEHVHSCQYLAYPVKYAFFIFSR